MAEKEAATRFDDEQIIEIEIERLRSFKDHPFKVEDDKDMHLLKDSIKKYGVLNPLIVRPVPDGVYRILLSTVSCRNHPESLFPFFRCVGKADIPVHRNNSHFCF